MALTQSAQGEVTTPENPVVGNGFLGIGGAAGIEPAVVAQERTHAGFVATDKKNEQATH
jgi:hypothetical protein